MPGRSCGTAVHFVKSCWSAAEARKMSCGSLFVNLTAAFYSTIRQLVYGLPGEEELLEETLETLAIPQVLMNGVRSQLKRGPLMEPHVDSPHLLALLREAQRGAFWVVQGADVYVIPRAGCRPGTIMATDGYNIAFASIQADIEDEMEDRGLKWCPQ
eukprot:1460609-Pyramimonas_sp.AAC.1